MSEDVSRLMDQLAAVPDPRRFRGRRHVLAEVLFVALAAMVGGADDAEAIEDFGIAHEGWFRQFLVLEHGIPSQDTILRIFAAVDPTAFQAMFRDWVVGLRQTKVGGHVAIDGKTLRRSFDHASGAKSIHMVSAWLAEDGLVLGQMDVAEKTNEITAIPELIRLLDVQHATITIDAMGCQKAIAAQIIDSQAHYVLAAKGNQPTLEANIVGCFRDAARTERPLDDPPPHVDTATQTDSDHGRVEERTCTLIRDLSWIENRADWPGLNAIAMIRSTRHDKRAGTTTTDSRVFILSDPKATAEKVLNVVRSHWGIENRLHWVLDMTFDEDWCRTRAGHAAKNLAVVRHAALNLLRNAPTKKKMSIVRRRRQCGWDLGALAAVIVGAETSA